MISCKEDYVRDMSELVSNDMGRPHLDRDHGIKKLKALENYGRKNEIGTKHQQIFDKFKMELESVILSSYEICVKK